MSHVSAMPVVIYEALPKPNIMTNDSRLQPDNKDSLDCPRCDAGHSQIRDSECICLISNSNLCPCCHQALTAFSSWTSKDEWKASFRNERLPQHLYPPERTASFAHPHHHDIRNVQTAVRNYGCRLCSLFMGPYSQGFTEKNRDQSSLGPLFLKFQAVIEEEYDDPRLRLNFSVRLGTERQNDITSILQLVASYQELKSNSSNLERATMQTSSDYSSTFSLAKGWLEDCLHSHPKCNIGSSPNLVNPTRLISIHGPKIHLCRGDSLPLEISYVTLSHCWGSLDILTLITRNLEALHSNIEMNDLCKTFQDAIQIALQLGYRYLWIDSLCIIQDSKEDWVKESTSMTQVYGNSKLNIAATGASDGSKGCFFHRVPAIQQKFEIGMLIGGQLQNFRFFDGLMAYHGIEDQPLAKRAWTVQERILPPRTLHFSEWEVFWECNTKSVCESFPDEGPTPTRHGHYEKHTPLKWETVVMMYSSGSLTKSRDKLIAIAGIAQTYGSGEDYLAGMWRPGLEFMLQWVIWIHGPQGTPRQSRAPSWSWASMDGGVHFFSDIQEQHSDLSLRAKITDAWVDLLNGNPFGEVRGGVLQLDCQLLALRPMELTNPDGLFYDFKPYRPIPKSQLWTWGPLKWDHCDDYEDANLRSSLYFVPIYENTLSSKNAISSMEGLMLRSTGSKRGQYRRVGWFNIPHPRPNVEPRDAWDWLELAISQFETNTDTLDPEEYVSIHRNECGERRCSIEII